MIAWKVGASHPGAPLLVGFLVGPEQHPRLVDALPGWSIVTTAANGLTCRPRDVETLASMHQALGVVLAGHSAGCQGVRSLLVDSKATGDGIPLLPHTTVQLLGVVVTDGTHANYPTPAPWQVETWQRVADLARARRIVAAFTCSQMGYVERLPSPFMATRHVLQRVLGVDLLPDVELRDGALFARGYPSPTGATPDAAVAHNRQLTHVMPMLLREHVHPFVGGGGEHLAERDLKPANAIDGGAEIGGKPAETTSNAVIDRGGEIARRVLRRGMHGADVKLWQLLLVELGYAVEADGQFGSATQAATCELQRARGLHVDGAVGPETRAAALGAPSYMAPEQMKGQRPSLREAALAIAREDLALGIRETAPNDGPEIRRLYLNPLGLPPGSKWCAPAVTSWLRRGAERAGVPMPIAGSASAKAIRDQLVARRCWVPRTQLEGKVAPGWILVWDRSIPGRPETSWWGHTGLASEVNGRKLRVIEGNSGAAGDELALMDRSLDDPRLLGGGPAW